MLKSLTTLKHQYVNPVAGSDLLRSFEFGHRLHAGVRWQAIGSPPNDAAPGFSLQIGLLWPYIRAPNNEAYAAARAY